MDVKAYPLATVYSPVLKIICEDIKRRNIMFIDNRLGERWSMCCHASLAGRKDVTDKLERENPIDYSNEGFYEYKFKKLLCSTAPDMIPDKTSNSIDEASGGYIIVTSKSDVLAYH